MATANIGWRKRGWSADELLNINGAEILDLGFCTEFPPPSPILFH